MPNPGLPDGERARRKAAVENRLRAGYAPPGAPMSAGQYGAIGAAAIDIKLTKNTMASWVRIEGELAANGQKNFRPDWTIGRAEQEPLPEIVPKPRVRVKASQSPEGAITKVLAIGDSHDCPEMPKDRFRWMGALANERGVDWVVQIGDFGSFDSLSSHIPNETLAGKLKNPYHHDAQSLNEAMGYLADGLAGHKPRLHCTMGNHERRVWLFENQRPEVAGMLTGELLQTFADHGWTTTEYGDYFFLAGVGFIHAAINRLGKTYGGKNSENTIANDAIFDHVIGHSHVKRDVRAPKLGPSKHVSILNLGCALPQGHVENYIYHGALSGWWWGCCVLTLQGGQITGVDAVPMAEMERRFA